MNNQILTFRDLFAPITAEAFFDRHFGRQPVHVQGHEAKLAGVFSWQALNGLLGMANIWSANTVKLVLDGADIPPESFCRPILNREGEIAQQVDPAQLRAWLRDGATMVLDLAESFSPTVASVCAALQVWFRGPASCNIYCSWRNHAGFNSHFDTTDVVVLQISGTKNWSVYDRRFEHPVDEPGYQTGSFSNDFHDQNKGALLAKFEMTPGDLLYLPKGQYHDALATSGASLHLTFSIPQATGYDVLVRLTEATIDDPLFRESLPTFDDVEALSAHLQRLASRMAEIFVAPQTRDNVSAFQRRRAFTFCFPEFGLPARDDPIVFCVRGLGARVVRRSAETELHTASGSAMLTGDAEALAEWVLARDYFTAADVAEAMPTFSTPARETALTALVEAGLIISI
jgi:ribosomal protein L16 Arg81 hydroxylase